jgi:MFS family permease
MDNTSHLYRFWPIPVLGFLKVLVYNIYGLALPNYLLFERKMAPSLVGVIYSAFAFAYIFGPIVFSRFSSRIGTFKAVLINTCSSAGLLTLQMFTLTPFILIVARLFDGLLLGLFWPTIQMDLSRAQKKVHPDISTKYFQHYSYGWNFGILVGNICGIIIVRFWTDYIALLFAWILSFSLIPISFLIDNPAKLTIKKLNNEISENSKTLADDQSSIENPNKALISAPFSIIILGVILFAGHKTFFNFALPIFLERNSMESYWVYVAVFFQQILQILCIILASKPRGLKKFNLMYGAVGGLIGANIIAFLFPIVDIIFWMAMLSGICYGQIYGVLTQIMLSYSSESENPKYVTLYEASMGTAAGITPIIVGYIAEINIIWNNIWIGMFLVLYLLYIGLIFPKISNKPQSKLN